MKTSMRNRLEQLAHRLIEVDALLAEPEIAGDMDRFRKISRERAELDTGVTVFNAYQEIEEDIRAAQDLMSEPVMRAMAAEEMKLGKARLATADDHMQGLMFPRDTEESGTTN